VLPEENDVAVEAFLGRQSGFSAVPVAELLASGEGDFALLARFATRFGLQLSPNRTGTDGFYLACVKQGD
jgi:16S rRNA (cytosine967-C5)-methyltransferase